MEKQIPDTIYGIKAIPYDASSELAKVCAYCQEDFMANHMLRKCCPQKFGKKDYCKNHLKVLRDEAKLVDAGWHPIQEFKPPPKLPEQTNVLPVVPASQMVVETPTRPDTLKRSKMIEIIKVLLDGQNSGEFSDDEIDQAELDLTIFDRRILLPNSNLYYIEIGNYAIFWTHKNKFLITHQIETLWISQL